jgi:hypothetical protein
MNDQTARQWRQAIAEAGTIARLRSLASELMRLDHDAPQADLLQLCLLRLKHLARDGGPRRAGDWGW